jgi:hypothetical protein
MPQEFRCSAKDVHSWIAEPVWTMQRRENLLGHVRFEVLTAVTMKNVIFWDIKIQFVLHRDTFRLRYKAQPVNIM